MFARAWGLFIRLTVLDRILLVILIISLLFKGITELVCWAICKRFNKDKTFKKKCIHLKSEKMHHCNLPKCKEKFFKEEGCNKKKCPGYRTSDFSIEQIKHIYCFPFWAVTFSKWTSELSTVLLLVRTLFNTLYTP